MFPRSSQRYGYLIISTQGNLPSAQRDAVSYSHILTRRGFKLTYYLDVTPKQNKVIRNLVCNMDITFSDLRSFPETLKKHSESKEEVDVVVAISSHGWRAGPRDYINFGYRRIMDTEISKWFDPLHKSMVQCLVLIDTCHSGTMCEFPSSGMRISPESNVWSISACGDLQHDMDDISAEFGFGGGLTSSVIDYLKNNDVFNVDLLFRYCYHRLLKAGVHPQLCWV